MLNPQRVDVGAAQPGWTTTRRLLVGPVGSALAVAGAWVVVAHVDPNQPGTYPVCPLLALTGWACPLCGGLRGAFALAHGDLGTAVDRNVLFVASLPILAVVWLRWLVLRASGRTDAPVRAPDRWIAVSLALLVIFGIARNTPWGAWLAP